VYEIGKNTKIPLKFERTQKFQKTFPKKKICLSFDYLEIHKDIETLELVKCSF
jgi:hypothetical protein